MSSENLKFANIMLLGRTGVGKSSFINYLIGREVSKVGTGMPVTQGFDTYEEDNVNGLSIRIFDSKGLEVMDYSTIKSQIIDFLKCKCGSNNVGEWIHSIFYCINVEARRLEPEEVSFIKNVRGEISQTVHIILTHCKETEAGKKISSDMKQYIQSQLQDERIHVYCVNSTVTKTRIGTFDTFGRKGVLDEIFKLLWSDISWKVAGDYAKELRGAIVLILNRFLEALSKAVKPVNTFSVLGDLIHNSENTLELMQRELDEAQVENEVERITMELNEKYQEKIRPLIDFCNRYGDSMGQEIELYEPFEFADIDFDEFDMDLILQSSKLGKFMEELEEMDSDNIWEGIQMLGKGVGMLFSINTRIKELIVALGQEMFRRVPSVEEIEKSVYDRLMEAYCE